MLKLLKFSSITLLLFAGYQGFHIGNNIFKARNLSEGQTRQEALTALGNPSAKWAKSSPTDYWRTNFLLGGLALDVLYEPSKCDVDTYLLKPEECIIVEVRKWFYSLWGNRWLLFIPFD